MIKATIDNCVYNIPTCWDDISFYKCFEIIKHKNSADIIKSVVNIPDEKIASSELIDIITRSVSFLEEVPYFDKDDMNELSFGSFIEAMMNEKELIDFEKYLYFYTFKANNLTSLDFFRAIDNREQCITIVNEHIEYISKYAVPEDMNLKLAKSTKEQGNWGWYDAIDTLADYDVTKHDIIERLPTWQALTKLKKLTENNYYAWKTSEIAKLKMQQNSKKRR